jgi:hypothetical protein
MDQPKSLRLWKIMVAIAAVALVTAAYVRVFRSDLDLLMIVLAFSPGPLLAATWQAIRGRDPLNGGLLGGAINGVGLGIVEMATTNPVDIVVSGLLYLMVFFIAGVGWGAIIGNAIRWLAGWSA